MLKQFTALLMICTVLAANMTKVCVYAGFLFNQNYISSTLCENRNKPLMHCNGKCYLAKKLKLAEETEKKQSEKSGTGSADIMFFQRSCIITCQPPPASNHVEPVSTYTHQCSSRSARSIFRPPKLAV